MSIIWVKQKDRTGQQYTQISGVDLHNSSVHSLKERLIVEEQLSVRPSRINLYFVSSSARKPAAAAEEEAVLLEDPSLPLSDAGVTGSIAWLLATVASAASAELPGESVDTLRL